MCVHAFANTHLWIHTHRCVWIGCVCICLCVCMGTCACDRMEVYCLHCGQGEWGLTRVGPGGICSQEYSSSMNPSMPCWSPAELTPIRWAAGLIPVEPCRARQHSWAISKSSSAPLQHPENAQALTWTLVQEAVLSAQNKREPASVGAPLLSYNL